MGGIDPDKGIIVSYQRSGLNWVRYCIETLTGLRTAGDKKLLASGELAVYRTHYVGKRQGPDSCGCAFFGKDGKPLHRRVVLLLRDYRESFIRESKSRQHYELSAAAIRRGRVFNFRHYFENLRAFDEFSGPKLLVRYERLIQDFAQIMGILDFLQLPYDLEGFDLVEHRQRSLAIYDKQHKAYTRKDPFNSSWHRERVTAEIREALDAFVDENYGAMVDRYFNEARK